MIRFYSLFLGLFFSSLAYSSDAVLLSKAFAEGITIPTLYTCDGQDISPDLYWSNLPSKTKYIAIILADNSITHREFYHWVIFNIPAQTMELKENLTTLPSGAIVTKNSFGNFKYNGPCPPKGSLHNYTFTLYALDQKINLTRDTDVTTLKLHMKKHILQELNLKFGFARWPT